MAPSTPAARTCCLRRRRVCTAIASSPTRCRSSDRSASIHRKTGPKPNGNSPTSPRITTITTATNVKDKQENVKAMEVEAHRDLRLLEAVHEDSRVTQRGLA